MSDLAEIHIENNALYAIHNYPCPVCIKEHAIYNCQDGEFQPCWTCQCDGWRVVRRWTLRRFIGLFMGTQGGPR